MSIPLLVAIPRRFNSYDREFQWGHNDGVAGDVTFFAGSGEKALLAYSVGYALGVYIQEENDYENGK